MNDSAYPALLKSGPVFKAVKALLVTGVLLWLPACERNEPVPDPAPAPPAPRTLNDEPAVSVQSAVFHYDAGEPVNEAIEPLREQRLRLPRT